MANPTSSQKLTALAVEAPETFPLLHSKIVQVTGVLATPQLSHTQPFSSNLSLNDIVNSLATQLEQKARAEFGLSDDVRISLDKVTIDSKNLSEIDMKSRLRNLEPERRSSMGSCTLIYTPNPDFVRGMIAQKKELIRENLVLSEDLGTLAPKRKNKGNHPKSKRSSALVLAPSKKIQPMSETWQNLNSSPTELPAAESDSQILKAMQKQMDLFRQQFADQEKKFAEQEERNAEFEKENIGLNEHVRKVEGRLKTVENENVDLRDKVERLTTAVKQHDRKLYRLYRRVVLDDAREKLFELCNITRRPDMSNEDLHNHMKGLIRENHRPVFDALGDDAFRLIFVGKLRERANKVAHKATKSELSLAISDSQLSQSTRDALAKVYRYAEDEDPIFSEIESQV
ncbi:hypothetical protein Hypma_016532 [Hypsizygus marmoreus]|uniref:Uncharacterized protein n=1 Tax=Hypsizygus marmoreus TaxID=39966 RepID=A0A369J7L2_HYPMA|nr:hypothetical protein Hypma_016532 [Hypsizygus marmoreus]